MAEALTNRGTTWTDREVKALLSVWEDSKIQEELDGAVKRSGPRWCSSELHSSSRTKELRVTGPIAARKLQTRYGEVKDNNCKTGKERQTCKFYSKLNEILGHRPASVPSAVLDTGESSSTHPEMDESGEEEIDGKGWAFLTRMYTLYLCCRICRWNTDAGSFPHGWFDFTG